MTNAQVLPRTAQRWAIAASAWALLFAALSVYWVLGGMAGIDTLGGTLEAQGRAREPDLIRILWITATLKALLAAPSLLLLALDRRPQRQLHPRLRHLTHLAIALIGAGLTLYALALLMQHTLMAWEVIDLPTDISHAENRWHLLLWDPIWLVGGLSFLLAALHARPQAPRHEPARR